MLLPSYRTFWPRITHAELAVTNDQVAKITAGKPRRLLFGTPKSSGVAMTEQDQGAKKGRSFRELLAALLDALKDALLALRPQTLFVTDTEMIRRIGVPDKIARAAIRALDENPRSRFPQKSALWGNRRYWPAIEDWFQKQHELETGPESKLR